MTSRTASTSSPGCCHYTAAMLLHMAFPPVYERYNVFLAILPASTLGHSLKWLEVAGIYLAFTFKKSRVETMKALRSSKLKSAGEEQCLRLNF